MTVQVITLSIIIAVISIVTVYFFTIETEIIVESDSTLGTSLSSMMEENSVMPNGNAEIDKVADTNSDEELIYHRTSDENAPSPPVMFENEGHMIYSREIKTSFDDLENLLKSVMSALSEGVDEVKPLVWYINRKVDAYKNTRKHDKLTVVGSFGNKLFFPEQLSDGTYHIELDILFERPYDRLVIPTSNDQNGETFPSVSLRVHTTSQGSALLEVKDINNEHLISEFEKPIFLQTNPVDGKTYLKSHAYMSFIPKTVGRSVMGEREMDTFTAPLLPTLFRTFRTYRKTLKLHGKLFSFLILMDKVAGLWTPWPDIASEFHKRPRILPSEKTIEDIIKGGCHLVYKPQNQAETYHMEFKFTFSTAEQKIALEFSPAQRSLFLLIKQIKRRYLDMGTLEDGEPVSGLTTYHLKTIMLWMNEQTDPSQWEVHPLLCLQIFFRELEKCLVNRFCPHYFMLEINVMETAWIHKRMTEEESKYLKKEKIRSRLITKVQQILAHPEEYINYILLFAIDERHALEAEKKPRLGDPQLHNLDLMMDADMDLHLADQDTLEHLKLAGVIDALVDFQSGDNNDASNMHSYQDEGYA